VRHRIGMLTGILIFLVSSLSLTASSDIITVDSYYDELNLEQTRVYVEDREIVETSKWIPVRQVFEPYVEAVAWDHVNKIATVRNNGTSMMLLISDKPMTIDPSQVIVPHEYVRYSDNITYIDASWLCYLFDPHNKEEAKEQLAAAYSFLGIDHIEAKPSVKDATLHMFIMH